AEILSCQAAGGNSLAGIAGCAPYSVGGEARRRNHVSGRIRGADDGTGRIGSDQAAETDIDACAAERHVRARERDRAGAESRAAVRTDQATGHHAGDSPAIDLTAREDIADGAGIAAGE